MISPMRLSPALLVFALLQLSSWVGFAESTRAQAAPARAYWVFFSRPAETPSPTDYSTLAERIPRETWARRGPGALPDRNDLDVPGAFVDAVRAHGRVRHVSRWFCAVSAELDARACERVAALPFVRELRPVARMKTNSLGPALGPDGEPLGVTLEGSLVERPDPSAESPLLLSGPPSGPAHGQLAEIGATAAHDEGFTGNRVRVMMLDTGFRKDHAAFSATRLDGERDFVFGDGETQNEVEDNPTQHRHGTGCWAVCGGFDPGRIVGPAYGATFFLAKTEDIRSETQVEEDNYVAALEWADSLGVRVTSASLSYLDFDDGEEYEFPELDGDTAVITRAVDLAAARGILCVSAMGNTGPSNGTLGTPADADSMLAVGAVDSLNNIAQFSSRGPTADGRFKPEVVARGQATWWADAISPNSYGFANGTSLSTPLVGGAAALVFEAHPEWGAMQVRDALMATADRHLAPDFAYGHGRIDVDAAIHSAPLVYPLPFDLLAPADEAELDTLSPALTWRSSVDPDETGPLQYLVSLRPIDATGAVLPFEAGSDSVFTPADPLLPGASYRWEVVAVDTDGNRRIARQSRLFHTPAATAGPIWPDRPERGIDLALGPNPFNDRLLWKAVSPDRSRGTAHWAIVTPAGRRVAGGELASDVGRYDLSWDGRDPQGERVAAGVYYLELVIGSTRMERTVVKLPVGSAQ